MVPERRLELEDDSGLRLVTPDALWSVGYDEEENVRVTRFDPESLQLVTRSKPIRSCFTDAVSCAARPRDPVRFTLSNSLVDQELAKVAALGIIQYEPIRSAPREVTAGR